jgi:D-inositol-3-phosphate glycosyltransferase
LCLPVVAARTGGLAHVVCDGMSGMLVDGWDPADHAAAALDPHRPALEKRLREGAVEWSQRFSWDSTADRFLELYGGVRDRVGKE